MTSMKTETKRSKRSQPFASWLALPDVAPPLNLDATNARLPILVVGAGPAGLAAMSALSRAGIEFVGIDSHRHVGGIWDVSNPVSSIYEGMHTVTSRYTMAMGPPMPADWPDYLPHTMAHTHLLQFVEDEKLAPHIRLATSFEDATKTDRGTWLAQLRTAADDQTTRQEFRAIVFATGACNRSQQTIPAELHRQAESEGIKVLHSSDFKSPAEFAGKRVVIVGIGNSGSDIADKISRVAARTLIAVRTSPWINPQFVFGKPLDKLAVDTPAWLPDWYRLSTFHVIRRILVGGFRRLGLSRPRHGLNDRLPISDRGVVAALREGRVVMRSTVVGFTHGAARFEKPSHADEPVDVVIFATGFARKYPLLCEPTAPVDSVADALSFLIFHRREPGLAYVAETVGLRGGWPIFVEQARAIAAYFAAEADGRPNVRRFNSRRTLPTPNCKGTLFRGANKFHIDYDIYQQALRELSAWIAE